MGCGKLEKSLALIAAEPHPPTPWRDGTQIPWHDSDFSERMLKVHLDQSTHMASRSREVIVSHVRWLTRLLESTLGRDRGLRILDIGCGPGLYCHELARRGHSAVGFDFAPAPLRWARETADSERLECEFHHLDLTRLETADIESLGVFDAVTFWFGEFHSFPTATARRFLPQLAALLRPGGVFALEFQTFDSYPRHDVQEWTVCESSVLSDRPHLWLQEYHWDEELDAEINVHWVIDSASGDVERYAQSSQAYPTSALADLFAEAGLESPVFHPPITGVSERFEFEMMITRKEDRGR